MLNVFSPPTAASICGRVTPAAFALSAWLKPRNSVEKSPLLGERASESKLSIRPLPLPSMSSAFGQAVGVAVGARVRGRAAGGERAQARRAQAGHLHEPELADAERAALLVGDERALEVDERLRERLLRSREAGAQAQRAELHRLGRRDRRVRLALLRGEDDGAEVAAAGRHELERRALPARHLEREAARMRRASAAPRSPRARARAASCPSPPRTVPVIFMLGVAACAVALVATSASGGEQGDAHARTAVGTAGHRASSSGGPGAIPAVSTVRGDTHVPRARDDARL